MTMEALEAGPAVPNFAEIAVELRLAERAADYKQMSFACKLEAYASSETRNALLLLAATIGLDADVARNVVDQWQLRAKLLDRAAEIFKALIPHEDLILELIAKTTAATAGQVDG